jgi:hypothetical protein
MVGGLLAAPSLFAGQTTASELLDRAIERLGGEAYLAAREIRASGRFFQFQRGALVGGDVFVDYIRLPDAERTEFGKDAEIIRINRGDRGWNVTEEGVEEQLPAQVEVFTEEFQLGVNYVLHYLVDNPETTLQYIGRDMLDFSRVDVLEVRTADRTRINLFVERDTGILVKKTVRKIDNPTVYEEVYSNYHDIDGVYTPLLVVRYENGQKTMEIRYQEVSYDDKLPDQLFAEPSWR